MSRAFVKEDDGDASEDLPARPISSIPNYVTPKGLAFLEERVGTLGARRKELAKTRHEPDTVRKLKEVERDLRYYECRLETAKLVDHSKDPPSEILFGAEVSVKESSGETKTYYIVGEDEADFKIGKICWASPLAGLLLGKKVGDTALWDRGEGEEVLRVTSFCY